MWLLIMCAITLSSASGHPAGGDTSVPLPAGTNGMVPLQINLEKNPSIPMRFTPDSTACKCNCAPRKIRDDYTYSEGIGAHKLHTIMVTSWNAARKICIEEGGHLAVINSETEALALQKLFSKAKDVTNAFIGVHDIFEEDDWMTSKLVRVPHT